MIIRWSQKAEVYWRWLRKSTIWVQLLPWRWTPMIKFCVTILLTSKMLQAKPVAKKLALARLVSVYYFASLALLAKCLVSYLNVKALRSEGPVSYLSVKALRAEGPVSYLSIAALRAQRNRSYIKKNRASCAHVLMQPNEFDACARSCLPWRNFVTEVGRGHVLR